MERYLIPRGVIIAHTASWPLERPTVFHVKPQNCTAPSARTSVPPIAQAATTAGETGHREPLPAGGAPPPPLAPPLPLPPLCPPDGGHAC